MGTLCWAGMAAPSFPSLLFHLITSILLRRPWCWSNLSAVTYSNALLLCGHPSVKWLLSGQHLSKGSGAGGWSLQEVRQKHLRCVPSFFGSEIQQWQKPSENSTKMVLLSDGGKFRFPCWALIIHESPAVRGIISTFHWIITKRWLHVPGSHDFWK